MKEKIEKKLFKLNYLILTPKIHSFGGFFESFCFGLKLKSYYNKNGKLEKYKNQKVLDIFFIVKK